MKAVLQRVTTAFVEIDGVRVGEIGSGIVLLLGIEMNDSKDDASWLIDKMLNLRIFEDDAGKMNRSVIDCGGAVLVVSQFTLAGNCNKGRRPSFDTAAPPVLAKELYEFSIEEIRKRGVAVATGVFQADMKVHLVNDGPVTIVLESPLRTCTVK